MVDIFDTEETPEVEKPSEVKVESAETEEIQLETESVTVDLKEDQELVEITESLPTKVMESPKEMSAYVEVNFGTQIERFPIPKTKFADEERAHLMMFTEEVMVLRYHYIEDTGYVYSTPELDKIYGTPPIRYGIPVIQLETNGSDLVQPLVGKVKILVHGEDIYKSLIEKRDDYQGILRKVLKVKCTDASYQKIEIDVISKDVGENAFVKEHRSFFEQNKSSIKSMIARDLSPSDLQRLMGLDDDGKEIDTSAFFTG